MVLLATGPAAAVEGSDSDLQRAREYLNRQRQDTGLGPLTWSDTLARAAREHAAYLATHGPEADAPAAQSLHAQVRGLAAFTGETPAERARHAGYPHERVSENVSSGPADASSAVDHLMTAIYHRLGFLDPLVDEIGIGRAGRFHVFLMGRSDYARICRGAAPELRFEPPGRCLEVPVRAEYLAGLCARLPPEALFSSPHPERCVGGEVLSRDYMDEFCRAPPPPALFSPPGKFYTLCAGQVRVAAAWWERFCADPPSAARYAYDGKYYEVCDGTRRVHARWWRQTCAALPAAARYTRSGHYYTVCDGLVRVHAEDVAALDARRHEAAPDFLLWPPDGSTYALPAFYDEDPDPVPDRTMTGNPVSVQFNPQRSDGLALTDFRLYRVNEDGRLHRVSALPVLTERTDPNGLLSPLQFALFPETHLGWNQRYEVQLEARLEGGPLSLRWGFRTRAPDLPLFAVDGPGRLVEYTHGAPFAVFVPPGPESPRPFAGARFLAPGRAKVTLEPLDFSTVAVDIRNASCIAVVLEPHGVPPIRLRAKGCGKR